MKVTYKGKNYQVRWPKRFDAIILRAAKKYKQPNGYVLWKQAADDGALKGLPRYLTNRDFSHRYTFLKFKETDAYQEKKLADNEKYKQGSMPKSNTDKLKTKLFKENLPEDLKKKHGWKPRAVWTKQQQQLLKQLTKIYRKSKVTIDWTALVTDDRINKLPYQDQTKLMKYYGEKLSKKKTEKQTQHKRKDAIRYKYENYDTYLKGQSRRYKIRKDAVNEFLISQLPLR